MDQNSFYATTTTRSFSETCKRVQDKAGWEGFKVLQVHDMKTALKEKGFEIEPLVIVEVCNAGMASEALGLDPQTALLMPCKVVVQEKEGLVTISTFLPEGLVEGKVLRETARKIGVKLISLVDSAASTPSCCTI